MKSIEIVKSAITRLELFRHQKKKKKKKKKKRKKKTGVIFFFFRVRFS